MEHPSLLGAGEAHPELPAADVDARDSRSARCCKYLTERLGEAAAAGLTAVAPKERDEDGRQQLLLHSRKPRWALAQKELRVPAL
jgi:hypothetical protein